MGAHANNEECMLQLLLKLCTFQTLAQEKKLLFSIPSYNIKTCIIKNDDKNTFHLKRFCESEHKKNCKGLRYCSSILFE